MIDVNCREYESKTAFARDIGRRYHINYKTIKGWIFDKRMSLNEIERRRAHDHESTGRGNPPPC